MTLTQPLRIIAVGAATAALVLGPLPLAMAEGPGYGGDAGALSVAWEAAPAAPQQAPSTPAPAATVAPADPAPAATVAPADPAPAATVAPADPAPAATEPAIAASGTDPALMSFGGSARGVAAAVVIPRADPQLEQDPLALVIRGLGFRGKSKVEVRVGSDSPVVARADTAGALSVALDANRLTGTQPGVSVMAVGRNQSGTEVTLFGSIPPKADGSGPMSLVPWAAASLALVGLAFWSRRRHAQHRREDPVVDA